MTNPILTVGITTYERPGALRRAVESILDQSSFDHGDVEVIVVDDASKSKPALEYLSELESRKQNHASPVSVIRHSNGSGGPSTGRNDVIDAGTGRYILFLDDDNSVLPGALSALVKHLRSSSADWVSLRRQRNGKSFFRSPEKVHTELNRTMALWTFLIAGAFKRESMIDSGVRFDPAIHYGEDSEFVLDFVTKTSRFEALADRDYVLEGDPLAGELPHISHLRPGPEFVEKLIRHADRLFEIIANAGLEASETESLGIHVLNRTTGSYNLHRKIADLKDGEVARNFMIRWSTSIKRTLTAEQAVDAASKRGLGEVFTHLFDDDVERFRLAVGEL